MLEYLNKSLIVKWLYKVISQIRAGSLEASKNCLNLQYYFYDLFCMELFTDEEPKTTFAIIAIVAAIGLAATVDTNNLAFAKITSETTDTSCTNGGGNQPGGQQPTCTGGGLTQETENQNPSGSAPPGQNK
jgi:hypothetical protein